MKHSTVLEQPVFKKSFKSIYVTQKEKENSRGSIWTMKTKLPNVFKSYDFIMPSVLILSINWCRGYRLACSYPALLLGNIHVRKQPSFAAKDFLKFQHLHSLLIGQECPTGPSWIVFTVNTIEPAMHLQDVNKHHSPYLAYYFVNRLCKFLSYQTLQTSE